MIDEARRRIVEEDPAGLGERSVGLRSVILEIEGGRAAGGMKGKRRLLLEQ
jgi:hypothetical protein